LPHRKRLLWLLYPSFLLITLAALLLATWYSSHTLRRFYIKETIDDLTMKADLLQPHFANRLSRSDPAEAQEIAEEFGECLGNRITVILPDGKVIADSEEHPEKMDNHADRPEIRSALAGETGSEIRFSDTLGVDMLYVAVPVLLEPELTAGATPEGKTDMAGVIRISLPLLSIKQTLTGVYARMAFGMLLAVVLTALVSLVVSRRIARPIEDMRRGAELFASGDFSHKLKIPDSREFGALAEAMNQMAVQLDDRIRTIVQHKNHLEALLTSMMEGVVAVDNNNRLTSINETAARLFNIDPEQAKGRPIEHSVRNADLVDFINTILTTRQQAEAELVLRSDDGQEIFLQAHGAVLQDSQNQRTGAVVVLNNLTNLRKLERIRSDFVANVSHELKTPVTSIKGFVETLQEGALQDPEAAVRFLGIIGRQADRLTSIIDDLLSLSRIEKEEETSLNRTPCDLADLFATAIDVCRHKADAADMTINVDCPRQLQASVNVPLLEQAAINLLDNAIKYSTPESTITLSARESGNEIVISVRDEGCGISEKDLSRIFERFYRVDKSRSRTLGGTGLGLSIVKHIVQLHGGTLTVESELGKGSTFEIHLPQQTSA